MNRSPLPDFSAVWAALLDHCQKTGRAMPRSLLIFFEDNAITEVKADGRCEEGWGDTPGEFPAPRGWSFRAGTCAFNGHPFRLGGLRFRLLRALVDANGEPVRDRVLKVRVWAYAETDDARLKDIAFGLRAVLRSELGLDEGTDPIERVEGGYRLTL